MPPDSPVAVDAHLGHPRLGPRRASAAMERVRAMAAGQGSRRARQPDETSHAGGRLRRFNLERIGPVFDREASALFDHDLMG